jgi:hypothetical protein
MVEKKPGVTEFKFTSLPSVEKRLPAKAAAQKGRRIGRWLNREEGWPPVTRFG